MHFYLLVFIQMHKECRICKKHLYVMHCYKYCNFVHLTSLKNGLNYRFNPFFLTFI